MTLMTVSGFNSAFTGLIIGLDFHAGKFRLLCTQVPEFIHQASFITTCLVYVVHVGRKGCLQPTGVNTAVTASYVVVNNGAISWHLLK